LGPELITAPGDTPVMPLTPARMTRPLAGALLAAGAAIAIAAGGSPRLAIAGAVGLAIFVAAARRPALALTVLVVAEVSSASSVIGSHAHISVAAGALTAAIVCLWRSFRLHRFELSATPLLALAPLLLVAQSAAQLTGPYAAGLGTLGGTCRDLLFLVVVVALLQQTGRVRETVAIAVGVVALLAGLSVVQEYILHNATTFGGLSKVPLVADLGGVTARHSGPEADVNFWGRTLVLFLPLALSLALLARSRVRRLLWLCSALALLVGEFLTGSRGGFLAAAAAIVLWLLLAGARTRRVVLLVPITVPLLLALPGVGSRLGTLTEVSNPASATADPSLVGRIAAQRAAAAMFLKHPLTGIGAGQFGAAAPTYLRRPGSLATNQILAPHNLYLQLAAEQGVVGLAAWLFFFGGALSIAARTLAGARRREAGPEAGLAAGALAALCGWATASIFLHLADFRILLLVVAVVAVLDARVRRLPVPPPVAPEREVARAGRRLAIPAIALAAVVGGGAGAAWAASPGASRSSFSASETAQVVPVASADSGTRAYGYDLLSRQDGLPTYLAIVSRVAATLARSSPQVHVTVRSESTSPFLSVVAVGRNEAEVVRLPGATIGAANVLLSQADPLFHLAPLPPSG
jgi:O-antigen ligase